MRKIVVFLSFLLSITVFFSCDVQIPTAIEVVGNPDLNFTAKKDIGETFAPQVEDYDVIKCPNTAFRTYIIRGDLLDEDYILEEKKPDRLQTVDYTVTGDTIIGFKDDIKISVSFDSVLAGFTLKPVIARVFINGEPANQNLVDVLEVKIEIDSFDDDYDDTYNTANKANSGLGATFFTDDEGDLASSFTSLPGSDASNIDLLLSKKETKVKFEIYIPDGTIINNDWFDGDLKTEILIWVPLEFIADERNENYVPIDPDDDYDGIPKVIIPPGTLFSEGKDLFGRSSPTDDDSVSSYIESLQLSIILISNPFEGKDLLIWSGPSYKDKNIFIEGNKMAGNSFSFPISEDKMIEVNKPDNYPFIPNFRIEYESGEELIIPWELKSTEFVFKAKINYRKEF